MKITYSTQTRKEWIDFVARWIQSNNWSPVFVDVNTFAQHVVDASSTQAPFSDQREVLKETQRQLSQRLYECCRNSGNPHEQSAAFNALAAYFSRLLRYKGCNDATLPDIVQNALVEVHKCIHQLSDPIAFLRFCQVILYRAFEAIEKRTKADAAQAQSLSQYEEDSVEPDTEAEQDLIDTRIDVESEVLDNITHSELWTYLTHCQSLSHRQRLIVGMKFLMDLSSQEIGHSLQVKPEYVDVEWNRAKKKLQKDHQFLAHLGRTNNSASIRT